MSAGTPIILEAPAPPFAWSEVLRSPGSRLDARVEGVDPRDGRYAIVVLQRVHGVDAGGLERAKALILQRYRDARFEVLAPPGPDGALVRTRLDLDGVPGPALRFALRFHDQVRDILVHLEGGRMCIQATPLRPELADETLARLQAFLAKQGLAGVATLRLGGECPCRDPSPAGRDGPRPQA